jgi:ABC-type phosphate/phosphonate transport system substrate-binding protein/tRNA A-37 threonylcarbamoyl transferase component Bud32
MLEGLKCSSCGRDIEADVTFRQCPSCLLDLALTCESRPEPQSAALGAIFEAGHPALLDYQILERIGRGGMGVVYRARQISLDRMVALKVIGAELDSPAALARFRREADAARKLDHGNIVPIYEIGEHEASPFLVMRLIEGASLADKLGTFAWGSGSTSTNRANHRHVQVKIAHLMATVARAVHYAHAQGVLHRDLKPSNILIDPEGNPHLTDFGIAKFIDQATALTQTAELLGTPCYMSPEQAAGKPLSPTADIYSLGVIFYELLTGRCPFTAERPVEILRKVMEEEPPPPALFNPSVDRDLATICLKCLDKNPTRRYASAGALAEDLERWQRHEPIRARPAGAVFRLRRWMVKNPALTTFLGALIIGIVLTLGLLAKAREEKNRKSIALAILRTETARQLQELWASPAPFFGIKSETLAALSGREPARLQSGEQRFTVALIAEGNPLDRILSAAPLLEHVERSMTTTAPVPTRLDLRLYKRQEQALTHLIAHQVDFLQVNGREFLQARRQMPGLQPLLSLVPLPGRAGWRNDSAVIFTRTDTAINTLSDLRGKSFLFGTVDSTLTFWAKVRLAQAGIRGQDLSRYRYVDVPEELPARLEARTVPDLGNPFSEMTPVEAILDGSYDAAVATERRFVQVAAPGKLRLLGRLEGTPLVLVGQSNISAQVAASLQRGLLGLKDSELLESFARYPCRFEIYSEADLAEMRNNLSAEALFDKERSRTEQRNIESDAQ